ncbi:hypothetical protein ACWIUD_00975 [Helicobacter sp. 23-1044]
MSNLAMTEKIQKNAESTLISSLRGARSEASATKQSTKNQYPKSKSMQIRYK